MRHLRISIAALLALVAFAAVNLAALREPSFLGASASFSLSLAILTAALVSGCVLRPPNRVGRLVTGIVGLVYLHAAFGNIGYPHIITTPLLDSFAEMMRGGDKMAAWTVAGDYYEGRRYEGEGIKNVADTSLAAPEGAFNIPAYRQTGHSILAVFVGLLGGVAARFLADRNDEAGGTRPSTR